MGQLIHREIRLSVVPGVLAKDFESWVLEAYFDDGWHDLKNVTEVVDVFGLYGECYEETGNPFTYCEDEERVDENADIIAEKFWEVMEDVEEVFRFHHIFHSYKDIGDHPEYEYVDCRIMPIQEVW